MSRQLLFPFVVASAALAHLPAQAVRFERATDTIRLTNNTTLTTECTIEAVVCLDGAGSIGFLFDEWTNNVEDKRLRIGPSLLEGYGPLSQGSPQSTSPIATDRWHHVAYVYKQSLGQQLLYLDGQRVATLPTTNSIGNGPGLGHLGATPHAYSGGPTPPPGWSSFRGYLDSFRISNTARYTEASFTPPMGDMGTDPFTLVLYNFNDPANSPTVQDTSGNGNPNPGTLGIGLPGGVATSPTLDIRVMTCQRTAGGLLNQQTVDSGNDTIIVAPGAPIQGSVNLLTNNGNGPNAVAPLAGTANWGQRTTQYWTIRPSILTGVNVYAAPVSVTAPTQPGTYYLIFGFAGVFGANQVMSSTHAAIGAVWFDGNDVGFDWTAHQFNSALANGGTVTVDMRMPMPNGSFSRQLHPFTAVRVNVGTPAAICQLGPGCPGSRGVPLLESSLPRIGTTVLLSCRNLVPFQTAGIFWGASRTQWNGVPLPLDLSVVGMTGCSLRSSLDFMVAGPNLGGVFFAGIEIPNDPSLVGRELHSQTIALDPGVNAFGAVLSNALTLKIGI